jgi:hypothetical protein
MNINSSNARNSYITVDENFSIGTSAFITYVRYNYSTIKLISSELKNFISPEIKKNKKIDDIFKIQLKNIYYNYSRSKKFIFKLNEPIKWCNIN